MGDPGTQMIIKGAMMAASMAMTAMQKIEGPRLTELDVTVADYGTPLSRFWGKRRFACPIIHAEKLREKKTTSKTKGGKYSDYKYFGTFAIAICDHEIEAVTRIWMDKHLVYDVTMAGPISPLGGLFSGLGGSAVKLTYGKNMRIYLGTEDQEPDPRYEAWCEDRYGPDSAPAYRGVAYIFFEDLPLEKFGNRIPQITVEAVNTNSGNFPKTAVVADAFPIDQFQFSPGYSRFFHGDSCWHTATRTRIRDGIETGLRAFNPDGTHYMNIGNGSSLGDNDIHYYTADGTLRTVFSPSNASSFFLSSTQKAGGFVCFFKFPSSSTGLAYWDSADLIIHEATSVPITCYFTDSDGVAKAIGGGTGFFRIYDLDGSHQEVTSSQGGSFCHAFDNGAGLLVVAHGTKLMLVDKATWTVTEEVTSPDSAAAAWAFRNISEGAPSFWIQTTEISSTTLETLRSINPLDWGHSGGNYIYDPVNHALISKGDVGTTMTWLYLDRADNDGVTLGDIVDGVSGWCDTSADTTALTQLIAGYSVTQGAGKDMIGPLLDIHDVDVRPHDFTVQFVNRGGAVSGTIATADFVREGDETRYTVTIKPDTDIARRISLTFADESMDQQSNTVLSQRPLDAMDSVREQQIDLSTYVDTPAGAQQKTDRYFRRLWNERESITNGLTQQYLAAEPADTYTLELDGVTRFARCTKLTIGRGRLDAEWVRDAVSFSTLGTGEGAPLDAIDEDEIYIPDLAKGFVFDIPLVQDGDSNGNPLLYFGVGGYGGSFPGATIYQEDGDGDELFAWNGVEAADKAVWGYVSGALGSANPNLWDRGNSISVTVYGELTTCTEADIEDNPLTNMAVIGAQGRYEIINFTTATLTGTSGNANVYTISGFKRGRRGTEWAVDQHETSDDFVLVSGLDSDAEGLSDVGTDFEFHAATVGNDPSASETIEVDFTGASLKPYAPARVIFTTDGTDLTGEIIRRTRVGGSWLDSGVVSLSENSEEYEVDVYVGATFKRTITVSGTDTFTYTAAMMSADGTTLSSLPTFNVYQMSDAVGRGFALAA
jgi:hypothetical protein